MELSIDPVTSSVAPLLSATGGRPAASFRERYALLDGDRELALLEGKSWGRRPVRLSVATDAAVEPGLLLFAAFVVRGLAEDASAIAGAAASTAATSS